MADFETFKLKLSPDLQSPGFWQVDLLESPIPAAVGNKGKAQPTLRRQDLQQLRDASVWPNVHVLTDIGTRVWDSMMTPGAAAAYLAAVQFARLSNKGLRIVVTAIGDEPVDAGADRIRLVELPLEVMYDITNASFLAPDIRTPISRSLQWAPDREAVKIALPLRILLVTAEPTDQPPVNAASEIAEIRKALDGLTGPGGAIELDECANATVEALGEALKNKRYHAVHFIAHGKFDQAGADPSPRAYLCLTDPATGETDPIDGETLAIRLAASGVMLAVFTACQSSSPSPDFPQKDPFPVRAFDGIAQRLLAGTTTDISAVVAMQFDLETKAAAIFSRHFYGAMVQPGVMLDEAVTIARREIAAVMKAGHRAWATPTVYWRCQRGKVFEFEPTRRTLTDDQRRELSRIDSEIAFNRRKIEEIAAQPAAIRPHLEPMRQSAQQEIDNLGVQRSNLLADTLRLLGGTVAPGGELVCSLRLRLKAGARIGPVRLEVQVPAGGSVKLTGTAAGADAGGIVPMTQIAGGGTGSLKVFIDLAPASRGPGEYEVGALRFQVDAGVAVPMLDLEVASGTVERDGQKTDIESLAAILFVKP